MYPNHANKIIIYPLAGWPRKDARGEWRLVGFEQSDNGIAYGSNLRIIAAKYLYLKNQPAMVVASGSKGQLQNESGSPFLADVMHRELLEAGLPAKAIIHNPRPNNTFEELNFIKDLIVSSNPEKIFIVSNKYHLGRVSAFISSQENLKNLQDWLASGKLVLVSAEEVVLESEKGKWDELIKKAYASEAMKKRMDMERQGIEALITGQYKGFPAIRPCRFEDSRRIWEIRNDPQVRQFSRYSEEIDFENHDQWFKKVYLESHDNFCFVLSYWGKVIGYCRFDFVDKQNGYSISLAIDPAHQGIGFGQFLLSESLKKTPPGKDILAEIQKNNLRSIKLFQKNNFKIYREDEKNCYLKLKR